MGGFGSGRRSSKKRTVEMCPALDAALLARYRFSGNLLTWTNSHGEQTLAVNYWVETAGGAPVLHLLSKEEPDGNSDIDEAIPLISTRSNFGGVRWWFVCACGRRMRKLYLPTGAPYFGCRSCHKLTYESAQTHDSRMDKLVKNHVALAAALNGKNPRQFLFAARAYLKFTGHAKRKSRYSE